MKIYLRLLIAKEKKLKSLFEGRYAARVKVRMQHAYCFILRKIKKYQKTVLIKNSELLIST